MKNITGEQIKAELEKIKSLYSGEECVIKFQEYIDSLIAYEAPKLSDPEIKNLKNKLISFDKGSNEQLDFIMSIIDMCLKHEDFLEIFGKDYTDELKILEKRNENEKNNC